ncbi:hypothetical protein HUG10_20945 (plasmid) [Halorarum halophilum]|uniref:Uncharacterized protein n=1 Tax=Halorarum halophilum TaxID=2743090 RepID=A0A7D5KP99_9EURY|nr:hypothetical protein [Halobaculum halophilum]QLG30055.1 hypothetical protein HUG10_20945 [Halobaculum halophilum]
MREEIPPADELEWIEMSIHAWTRWSQWTDSPGVGPIIAWNMAESITGDHGLYCDEARYFEPANVVLLVAKDDDVDEETPRTMVTVMTGATIKSKAREAILRITAIDPVDAEVVQS